MRLLGYLWALPNTVLGLAFGALGGDRFRWRGGVVEIEGRWLARWLRRAPVPPAGVEALTLGHVVLGRSAGCLDRCREHERVHVRQYERWGPFFLLAYAASSGWQWLRGRDPYRDNRFEREAYSAAPTT